MPPPWGLETATHLLPTLPTHTEHVGVRGPHGLTLGERVLRGDQDARRDTSPVLSAAAVPQLEHVICKDGDGGRMSSLAAAGSGPRGSGQKVCTYRALGRGRPGAGGFRARGVSRS